MLIHFENPPKLHNVCQLIVISTSHGFLHASRHDENNPQHINMGATCQQGPTAPTCFCLSDAVDHMHPNHHPPLAKYHHPIAPHLISTYFHAISVDLSTSLTETQLYNNLLSCIIIFSAFLPKQLHSPHSQNNHHQSHTCTHVYDILDPCTRLHILTRDCYYDANESWRCHGEAPSESCVCYGIELCASV